jgi:hypothetical protein
MHTDGLAGAADLRPPLLTFPRAHLDATFGLRDEHVRLEGR